MRRLRVGRVLLVAAALLALPIGRPLLYFAWVSRHDADDREPIPRGSFDDASRLNATPVAEVWKIPTDRAAAETQLQQLVQRASAAHVPISIAGARHSMGGHTIAKEGVVIDMLPFHAMELDETREVLRVQAGARWFEVLAMLNARGRSIAVMQSNSDFSVGGSISVNCHGWQCRRGPIASTVESFRILLADGSIARCSREENAELFSLVLGGYGLFGVVLDVDLRVVPNARYRPERFTVTPNDYATTFTREVETRTDIGMSYGRLSVSPDSFLQEATLTVFHSVETPVRLVSDIAFPDSPALTRLIVRGEQDSDYGKGLRWQLEQRIQPFLVPKTLDRNQLLSQPATVFENRSNASTDILHEYFVPKTALAAFVDTLRAAVLKHHADLLNVTIRDVERDEDTYLRYADGGMFALVLYFTQPRTRGGEAAMERLTRDLIDGALKVSGRYYLPYRLHATPEQFAAAYPQGAQFFELKRRYDPQELFRNAFYEKYGAVAR